jgi:hypothetical protein
MISAIFVVVRQSISHYKGAPDEPHFALAYLTKPKHTPSQNPSKTLEKSRQKQPLEKTVPNLRSQEVSREMASKSADMTFVG